MTPASASADRSSQPAAVGTWPLLAAAWTGVIAAAIGRIVSPGLRGNASDSAVLLWDRAGAITSYALAYFSLVVATRGAYELSRRNKMSIAPRVVAIFAVFVVLALVLPSFVQRLPSIAAVILALTSTAVAITAAFSALRAEHTRAVGICFAFFGLASLVRLGAWQLAVVAGEHASARLYDWSMGIASGAVMLDGLGQLAAAAWLGTRTRYAGQVATTLAGALAFVITWGAAQGVHTGAARWQAVLHTALADAPGLPPPYGLSAMATFLASAAILFSLVALLQRKQPAAITGALSLALLGHGGLDTPLRALVTAAGGMWLMIAVTDERALWRTLLAAREAGSLPPPSPRASAEASAPARAEALAPAPARAAALAPESNDRADGASPGGGGAADVDIRQEPLS